MIVGSAYVDLGGSCATADMACGQLTYHRKLPHSLGLNDDSLPKD